MALLLLQVFSTGKRIWDYKDYSCGAVNIGFLFCQISFKDFKNVNKLIVKSKILFDHWKKNVRNICSKAKHLFFSDVAQEIKIDNKTT